MAWLLWHVLTSLSSHLALWSPWTFLLRFLVQQSYVDVNLPLLCARITQTLEAKRQMLHKDTEGKKFPQAQGQALNPFAVKLLPLPLLMLQNPPLLPGLEASLYVHCQKSQRCAGMHAICLSTLHTLKGFKRGRKPFTFYYLSQFIIQENQFKDPVYPFPQKPAATCYWYQPPKILYVMTQETMPVHHTSCKVFWECGKLL